MPVRSVPGAASVALPQDGKLFAPASARNCEAIGQLLAMVAPPRGRALELASGTGQHVVAHAARLPGLTWQPTEVDAVRRDSIRADIQEAGLDNILPPVALDATAPGWAAQHGQQDLIVLVNLLHLVSEAEAKCLITEAAAALAPGGRFVIYGPFTRGGALTSDGDRSFDAALRAHDPETGYKDDFDVIDWLHDAGLELLQAVEMPANNLALAAEKPRG
jgi:SAM-dependent methyltransferase